MASEIRRIYNDITESEAMKQKKEEEEEESVWILDKDKNGFRSPSSFSLPCSNVAAALLLQHKAQPQGIAVTIVTPPLSPSVCIFSSLQIYSKYHARRCQSHQRGTFCFRIVESDLLGLPPRTSPHPTPLHSTPPLNTSRLCPCCRGSQPPPSRI